MNTHSCIKCGESYQDKDPEPYYCTTCVEEKKRIAAEIDAKLKSTPRKAVLSDWQIYQQSVKVRGGFPDARHFL